MLASKRGQSVFVLAALVTSAGVAVGVNDAPAGSSTIVRLGDATPISAHAGLLAYSQRNAGGEGYHLIVRSRTGVAKPLPVPARAVPFDVDLGPDERGRTWAVYSRCRDEPSSVETDGLPAYSLGRRCSVWGVRVDGGRERVLKLAAGGKSFVLPSKWGKRLAMTTHSDSAPSHVRIVVAGESRASARDRLERPGPRRDSASVKGLDLGRSQLLMTWRYFAGPGGAFPADDRELVEVRLNDATTVPRVVRRIELGPMSTTRSFSSPVLSAARVHFAQWSSSGSAFNRLFSYDLRVRRTTSRRMKFIPPAVAASGTRLYALRIRTGTARTAAAACGESGCELRRLAP